MVCIIQSVFHWHIDTYSVLFECMSFSSLYCVVLTIVPPWVIKIHSFIHYIACANNLRSSIGGINVSVI